MPMQLSLKGRKDGAASGALSTKGILVAVGGNELDEKVVRLACNLVRGTKVPVYAVHVIEMPWSEPVDASPGPRVTIHADELLDHACGTASSCAYKAEPELLQARSAGVALVDEAADRDCDLIVLGLPYKREHGEFSMGATVPYVLEHSPVPVWVVRGSQD